MSITRDDYELSWLSENYFENKDLFCASDIILQIAQVKIPELILDRSSQSSPAGSYKMANFDCLSYMDFTSNQDEKPEITKIPEETKTADSYSPSLPLVKNLKVSAKKEKKLAAVKSICGICQMEFKHKWIYERHLESHSTAKYYKCQVEGCNKSYKSKENLNLHNKNIHLNIKPYTCTYCELRFSHRNGIFRLT